MTLTVGSLFSGIGGLDLGLERAGMAVRWQVENDPYCQRVLAKHWPDVPRYGDIKELDPHDLEPVDLICGGFPCQPVSLAGRGRAQEDERWLWPEYARIIRGVRPRFVLVENVPGLLGRGVGDVLGDLAELGYDAEWQSISAAAAGAPHIRWRVFIVAYAIGEPVRMHASGLDGPKGEGEGQGQEWQWVWSDALDGGPGQRDGIPPLADTGGATGRQEGDAESCNGGGPLRIWPAQLGGRSGPLVDTGGWWATEPDVGRVAHGIPSRVDRLRGLGNAVVPQVAEYVGRRIVEAAA